MIRQTRTWSKIGMIAIASLLLGACGNKISLENYNKLKTGQTYDDVTKVIGDPARCDEMLGIRTCVWGDDKRGISVNFVTDKVILLSAHNLN